VRDRNTNDDRLDEFWNVLGNTITEGDGCIPLHLAVQWTPELLSTMWSEWTTSLVDRENTETPALTLALVGTAGELVARLVEIVPAVYPDVPWLAESAELVAQEARAPGTNPLLKDRLRAMVARGPAHSWLILRRGREAADGWALAWTGGGPATHKIWYPLREFVELARNLPHPPNERPWIDDIIASLGPPTLEQIVAAAEKWGSAK
jgi:hypothetical protein